MTAPNRSRDQLIARLLAAGELRVDMRTGEAFRRDRLLKHRTGEGYLRAHLHAENVSFTVLVHRIVCIAAHGLPPDGLEVVNHKNGQKTDNRPENLEWTNPRGNAVHAIRSGLNRLPTGTGENHYNARLSAADVAAIRRLRSSGATYAQIAARFGISWEHARNIVRRRNWKVVPT